MFISLNKSSKLKSKNYFAYAKHKIFPLNTLNLKTFLVEANPPKWASHPQLLGLRLSHKQLSNTCQSINFGIMGSTLPWQ